MRPEFQFHILNKRNSLLCVATFSLYTGAQLTNKHLFLFGIGCLTLLIIAKIISSRLPHICLKRTHYPRCFEGQDVSIELDVTSHRTHPVFLPELIEKYPITRKYYLGYLIPHKIDYENRFSLSYTVECDRTRGVYVLGPTEIRCSDPTGIYHVRYEVNELTNLYVYPKPPEMLLSELTSRGTLFNVGIETKESTGHSEEIIGIRRYRDGDSPRIVHWPSTARLGTLMVKEFDRNVVTEVTIFLDLYRLTRAGLGELSTIEYILKTAAAFAQVAIENSHSIQVFACSSKVDHVPLGTGTEHLYTILDRLVIYKPGGERRFEQEIMSRIGLLRRYSTVVLITNCTSIDFDRFRPLLNALIEQRIKIFVALIDDRSFMKIYREHDRLRDRAPQLEEVVFFLKQFGGEVFTLSGHEKLQPQLNAATVSQWQGSPFHSYGERIDLHGFKENAS